MDKKIDKEEIWLPIEKLKDYEYIINALQEKGHAGFSFACERIIEELKKIDKENKKENRPTEFNSEIFEPYIKILNGE